MKQGGVQLRAGRVRRVDRRDADQVPQERDQLAGARPPTCRRPSWAEGSRVVTGRGSGPRGGDDRPDEPEDEARQHDDHDHRDEDLHVRAARGGASPRAPGPRRRRCRAARGRACGPRRCGPRRTSRGRGQGSGVRVGHGHMMPQPRSAGIDGRAPRMARAHPTATVHRTRRRAIVPNGKPNIVVFWGDDIGITNLSCYSDGLMGYRTPNIDRVANEGMRFTDSYGEQSCTAGRSAFITGQSVYRTGLSKVGMPGSDIGMPDEDPTIAELLKPLGLRHRAVRQEPPGRPGPAPADRPRVRRVLRQPVPPQRRGGAGARGLPEARGLPGLQDELRAARRASLPGKPGRHADDRGHRAAHQEADGDDRRRDHRRRLDFIDRKHADDAPFFLWVNTTHMHFRTHTKPESVGQSGRWQSAVPRHDDRPRSARGAGAGQARRRWASRTTRSSSTRPTTART